MLYIPQSRGYIYPYSQLQQWPTRTFIVPSTTLPHLGWIILKQAHSSHHFIPIAQFPAQNFIMKMSKYSQSWNDHTTSSHVHPPTHLSSAINISLRCTFAHPVTFSLHPWTPCVCLMRSKWAAGISALQRRCGLSCVPQNVEVLTLRPVNKTLFENRIFADDQVQMKSFGWTLSQYDCFLKKGKLRHSSRQGWRQYEDAGGRRPSTS